VPDGSDAADHRLRWPNGSDEQRGAAADARRQFGNVTSLKEQSRAMWTWTFWERAGSVFEKEVAG